MNVAVGNKIKALRKSRKISQEEMAEYLRISQSAYARMEGGESHTWAIHILKICKVFEIVPEELLRIDTIGDLNLIGINTVDNTALLSEKVIEHYERRIKELQKIIEELKKQRKF